MKTKRTKKDFGEYEFEENKKRYDKSQKRKERRKVKNMYRINSFIDEDSY